MLIITRIDVAWKLFVAYFLSGSCKSIDLSDIIFSTIKRLLNISLNIKALVTDQESNFKFLNTQIRSD